MKSLILILFMGAAAPLFATSQPSTLYIMTTGCRAYPGVKVYINDDLIAAKQHNEALTYTLHSTGRMVVNMGEPPHLAMNAALLDVSPGSTHYLNVHCSRGHVRELNAQRGTMKYERSERKLQGAEDPALPLRSLGRVANAEGF